MPRRHRPTGAPRAPARESSRPCNSSRFWGGYCLIPAAPGSPLGRRVDRQQGQPVILAEIIDDLGGHVEDHGRVAFTVVGGPFRQADMVRIAGPGEGGPGAAYLVG